MVTNEEFIADEAFSRCRIIEAISPYCLEEVALVQEIKREENKESEEQEGIDISSSQESECCEDNRE
jgi:hypothetical protein